MRPDLVNTRCHNACPCAIALLLSAMQTRGAGARGVLEGVSHDPVHALVGVDLFLNRHFVLGAGLEAAADADIGALGVLAKHDEVHIGRRPPFSGHSRS